MLKEYIAEWRKQRVKEEEELKKLKEKQARRKVNDVELLLTTGIDLTGNNRCSAPKKTNAWP